MQQLPTAQEAPYSLAMRPQARDMDKVLYFGRAAEPVEYIPTSDGRELGQQAMSRPLQPSELILPSVEGSSHRQISSNSRYTHGRLETQSIAQTTLPSGAQLAAPILIRSGRPPVPSQLVELDEHNVEYLSKRRRITDHAQRSPNEMQIVTRKMAQADVFNIRPSRLQWPDHGQSLSRRSQADAVHDHALRSAHDHPEMLNRPLGGVSRPRRSLLHSVELADSDVRSRTNVHEVPRGIRDDFIDEWESRNKLAGQEREKARAAHVPLSTQLIPYYSEQYPLSPIDQSFSPTLAQGPDGSSRPVQYTGRSPRYDEHLSTYPMKIHVADTRGTTRPSLQYYGPSAEGLSAPTYFGDATQPMADTSRRLQFSPRDYHRGTRDNEYDQFRHKFDRPSEPVYMHIEPSVSRPVPQVVRYPTGVMEVSQHRPPATHQDRQRRDTIEKSSILTVQHTNRDEVVDLSGLSSLQSEQER